MRLEHAGGETPTCPLSVDLQDFYILCLHMHAVGCHIDFALVKHPFKAHPAD